MPTEALRAYAASRHLAYEEEGLLPPISTVLERGLGVGAHHAGVITSEGPHGWSSRGGFTKWPERATKNLCRGTLPGGVDGVVAHHQHLELRTGGSDDGESWYVVTETVVVARLPERSRAVCELNVFPGTPGGTQALFSLDLSGGRAPITVGGDLGRLTETRGGHTFDLNPAEDRATLDAIASPDTLTALAHAPEGTRVELVDGVLCVSTRGIVEDHGALDTMCAIAMGIANGVRAVVAGHGDLDPSAPLAPPPQTPRQEWLDGGVAQVSWERPPASVADARGAYEPLVSERAKGSGHRARGAILLFGLLGCVIWFGLCYWFIKLIDQDPLYGFAFAGVTSLIGIWKVIGTAYESGEEVRAGEVMAQAGPWGLEAFARGYAQARGLALEDPEAFRHQLASPLAGRPLRVMGGDLGGGVHGHVALWRDWTRDAHWLVAAVPAGDGTPEAAPPYPATRAGATLVVGRQVGEDERSAAALDALITEACRLAARPVVATP
ncbi:MAG: hypothetical protein QOI80_3006 [Solirubrobacteraceae bacterium]|nr:hypothetical protein [Solirubrobacteraceae bacterium]